MNDENAARRAALVSDPGQKGDRTTLRDHAPDEEARTREAMLFMLEDLEEKRSAIERSHREWMALVDAVRDPIMVHDAGFRIVRANRAYAERAGVEFRDIIGRPYWECFPKRTGPLPECARAVSATHATENAQEEEFTLESGEIFLSRAFVTRSPTGQYAYSLHLFENVTDRRQAQQALQRSERKFRALIEHASDLVLVVDREGTIRYVSPSVTHIGGYEPDKLLGMNFRGFMHPEDLPAAVSGFAKLIASPEALHSTQFRFRDSQGGWVVLEMVASNALAIPAIAGIVVNARDVTARVRTERALSRSNRALRTLSAGNEALVRAADEPALLAEMCRVIVEVGAYRVAVVGYAQGDATGNVKQMACAGIDPATETDLQQSWTDDARGLGLITKAIRSGLSQFMADVAVDPGYESWRDPLARYGVRSAVALPLFTDADERPFGAVFIGSFEADAFDADEARQLTELASNLAFGVVTVRTRTERYEARERLRQSLEDSIQVIAATAETRDPYTAGHQRRVAALAQAIGQEIGLSAERVHGLHLAAGIHDLGKIGVPVDILAKPVRLTDLEMELIRTHSEAGYDILKNVDFPWPIADIIRQHHERLDGSGYPQGLKGDQILLESRIVAVADVMEAMSSNRPYRAALGIEAALKEIERGRAGAYDPVVVDACVKLFREGAFVFQD